MTRIIALLSGKGGVGKTTAALNLGVTLANFGTPPLVIDSSFHTPHIGVHLGTVKLPNTIHQVLKGEKKAREAVYQHPSGMRVLPALTSLEALEQVDPEGLAALLRQIKRGERIIILDSSPGFSKETQAVIKAADEIYIIVTPELPDISDALRMKNMVHKFNKDVSGVILNKVRNDSIEMSKQNVETIMGKKVIGIIPHDESVRKAMYLRQPVAYSHPGSNATIGFKKVAAELLGQQYVDSLEQEEKNSLFSYTKKRLGL